MSSSTTQTKDFNEARCRHCSQRVPLRADETMVRHYRTIKQQRSIGLRGASMVCPGTDEKAVKS